MKSTCRAVATTGLALAALAPLLFNGTFAVAQGPRTMTVGELLRHCQEEPPGYVRGLCVGYVAGVSAGAAALASDSVLLYSGFSICGPQGVIISYGQRAAIFVEWAKANPAHWHEHAAKGIPLSLKEAWPC
jgi:hypothetical protein